MFSPKDPAGYSELFPGVTLKTTCYGDKTLMAEIHFEPGSSVPPHQHVYEQTGYMVSGHLKLTIGAVEHDVRPGDSWCIPGNVPHGAVCVEEAVVIEVFSPVREDYRRLADN